MNAVAVVEAGTIGFVCANCGIPEAEVGENKLEECTACQSVRYCSDKCREEDIELHSEVCEKRQAEMYDKRLFTKPEGTHRGECPLCFLPMPIDPRKSLLKSCCSTSVCKGCNYANRKSGGSDRCPFCREPRPKKGESCKRNMKRIKANDPVALRKMGTSRYQEGDYEGAFEYWTKAADLGDFDAHYDLGLMYKNGEGVEEDKEKMAYHWEKASIGGHPQARYNLGCYEERHGTMERSVKHFVISAKLGLEESMKALWKHYSVGNITKEELEATLRTHQAAIDEMKSPERDAAAAAVFIG